MPEDELGEGEGGEIWSGMGAARGASEASHGCSATVEGMDGQVGEGGGERRAVEGGGGQEKRKVVGQWRQQMGSGQVRGVMKLTGGEEGAKRSASRKRMDAEG